MSKIDFLKGLGWPEGWVEWIGDQGYVRLSRGRLAAIELTNRACDGLPCVDHWNGLHVRVLDSNRGGIDQKFFRWDHYLVLKDPQPHPNADKRDGLRVISYCGWRWYINVPEDTLPIVKAVFGYLNLFEEEPKWFVSLGAGEEEKRGGVDSVRREGDREPGPRKDGRGARGARRPDSQRSARGS